MNTLAFKYRYYHKQPSKTASGYKGVYFHKYCKDRPWKAYIRHMGWYRCIGYFATKEEAARAYDVEALRLKGEGTYLNAV